MHFALGDGEREIFEDRFVADADVEVFDLEMAHGE
jgi:hypothetical protein